MKGFFATKKFKVLLGIAVLLCAFMIRAAYTDGVATFAQQVMGAVAYPFQKASSAISDTVTGWLQNLASKQLLQEENEALQQEIRALQDQLVDYESMKNENQLYKKYLEIKDQNTDFEFQPAMVIGRDAGSQFQSFIIDKGSLQGVKKRDPVITADGLVGMIEEVGLTYSRVITIYDAGLNVGAFVSRTRDTGIAVGTVELAMAGQCKMSYLARDSGAAIGDLVLTSGGSVYPKGLRIGTILDIRPEDHGISLYAVIQPFADIAHLKDVFVITSFEGQGIAIGDDLNTSSSAESDPDMTASSGEAQP